MTGFSLPYLSSERLRHFISEAFAEDIGPGDYSSLASVDASCTSAAILKVKSDGILAGMQLAEMIFKQLDPSLMFNAYLKDGSEIKIGDVAFEVNGKARSILSGERLVLNCMQRMSGVATRTNSLQKMIAHTKAKVLDTRKTSPNSRIIEKWAVAIGGGQNHRYALYDMVMLKDNHIDFAGGIEKALLATRKYLDQNKLDLKIEIETRSLEELEQALSVGIADVIMLDNYSLDSMKEAVQLVNGRVPLEASGNVTEATIVPIAETGVDFISIGALTHSYKSLDLSLKAQVAE
ncbi:MAG TPA: carboxylating nicotinate-nucleotide diphosphorylase [Catalimonadaceae bacterium]|nr:carboxylating nicotinate-nucleotide diphosphorylase [Catalimonadaceae bacterium]